MRVRVRVRPGSSQTVVGGSHEGALVVRVRERAVDGKATAAALSAIASAFGVRSRDVVLVNGAASRSKTVEIAGEPAQTAQTLQQLLDRR